MPEAKELNQTPEPSPVANAKGPDNKTTDNYDDTAEIDKILETVISAQSPDEQETPPAEAEDGKPPATTSSKKDKQRKIPTPPAETTDCPAETSETPPAVAAAAVDEIKATKEESAMLKKTLTRKNQLLSSGFVRLNLYLKHIRSQLDQLQTHIDKLSQEALKDVRAPLADKSSWPKYTMPAKEDPQWKQFVDEIETLYKKVSPAVNLEVEDWPAKALEKKSEYDRDWDNTLVHLRSSARKSKEQREPSAGSELEEAGHRAEAQAMDSFGAVRESLRRIQDLMSPSTDGEEEPVQIQEAAEQTPTAQTAPESEATPSRSDKLNYRQFVRDLKHSDRIIRIRAAEILAKSKLKSTPEVLIDAWCGETEPEVRSAIIKALVELDYKEAVSFFTEALDESDVKVQMAALEGLYKFETDKKTIAGLLKALRSRYYHIRRRAVTYLGWSKVEVALPQLLKILKDENEFVRKAAVSTLFALRKKEAIPHLIETLHDSTPGIRKKTIEVLYRWTGLRNDFKANASGPKRLEAIDRWKEWWEKNGGNFRISKIYRVEESKTTLPAAPEKEKTAQEKEKTAPTPPPVPAAPAPTPKEKKLKPKTAKKKTAPPTAPTPTPAPARPSRRKRPAIVEDEHLVLASDIFPGPVTTSDRKKKTTPRPTAEKELQDTIFKASGGITLMELGDKLGVKWQTLIPKVKNLMETNKIKKAGNKYMKKVSRK